MQGGDDFLAAQAVLRRQHRAVRKQVRDRREGLARLVGLGGDDAEVELRQFAARRSWPSGRAWNSLCPVTRMPRSLMTARVLLAADQDPHLGDARQMRGV